MLLSHIVVERYRLLSFSEPLFLHWFAAQAILAEPRIMEGLLREPQRLESSPLIAEAIPLEEIERVSRRRAATQSGASPEEAQSARQVDAVVGQLHLTGETHFRRPRPKNLLPYDQLFLGEHGIGCVSGLYRDHNEATRSCSVGALTVP